MRLVTEFEFDGSRWRRTNHLPVFEERVDVIDDSNWPKRCDLGPNPQGHYRVDIRLANAHRIVATLFFDGIDMGTTAYYYRFPNGKQVRWGGHMRTGIDEPCHVFGLEPRYRIMFLNHLQIDAWQPKYDILVLGRIGDIELVEGEWTCQISSSYSGIVHGTVSGPTRSPEDFVSLVDLYLSAIQSTPVSIPWMGVHKGNRLTRMGYNTDDDTVYIRTVVDARTHLHSSHEHGFREYMPNPGSPGEYFPLFCHAVRKHNRLRQLIVEWMRLRTLTYARPTLIEGFRTLRSVVATVADDQWPKNGGEQHKLMRKTIPQWDIPEVVTKWLRKNVVDSHAECWYDAVRELRNAVEHRENVEPDYDTLVATSQMSRDVVNRLCWLLWHQIMKAGEAESVNDGV